MKKVILFVALAALAVFALAGCGTEVLPVEEPEKVSENFTFAGIDYRLDETCGEEVYIKKLSPHNFYNQSPLEQSFVFNPGMEIYEESGFRSDDTRAFAFTDEAMKVKVPRSVLDDMTILCDDGARWSSSDRKEYLPPGEPTGTVTIPVPPYHMLRFEHSVTLKTVSALYNLRLKGVEFGEGITVSGTWTGTFFIDCCEVKYAVEPISTR